MPFGVHGANFSALVGPNRVTMGVWDAAIRWPVPESFDTAAWQRFAKATAIRGPLVLWGW